MKAHLCACSWRVEPRSGDGVRTSPYIHISIYPYIHIFIYPYVAMEPVDLWTYGQRAERITVTCRDAIYRVRASRW